MAAAAETTTDQPIDKPQRPKGLKLLRVALSNRKSACMLAFGLSSGLPFALLIGTLNAWLGEVGVNLATIGVLSWIGLSYSFQFLWSPLVDRLPLPLVERIGRRKSWILCCQLMLVAGFAVLAITNPGQNIDLFALVAFVAALASATQDIAINGWRIDVADEESPIELLTAIYQFGYRTASIIGGAFALFLAAQMSWPQVYLTMAVLMALLLFATFMAPDTQRPAAAKLQGPLSEVGAPNRGVRAIALTVVGLSWLWAIWTIADFMMTMLSTPADAVDKPSVGTFTKSYGPLIIFATVLVPLVVAGIVNWLQQRGKGVLTAPDNRHGIGAAAANHLYSALIAPLTELCGRLKWGVLIVIGFMLTYALCYNIWASFAYPFYLEEMKYSKEEVAFASKIFGIIMTMLGISIGGYMFTKVGRFPTVLLGAILPPLGNLLYADLAEGSVHLDAVSHLLGFDALALSLGSDERMVRLLMAICYENISTGLALTAFIAYVSSIVSKQYSAIQYALLSSLLSLVGTLGRGVTGEAFDTYGYAPVFRWTAATAFISVFFVLLEWARVSRIARKEKAMTAAA